MISEMEFEQLDIRTSALDSASVDSRGNVRLLTLNDMDDWTAYIKMLPPSMQDVYFFPEYYQIYEKNGDGKARCFVFEKNNKIALYPFLINRINDIGYDLGEEYFDIQGAYGYNGSLSSTNEKEFIVDFNRAFNNYCKQNNIVVEFTRFHPLLENNRFSENFLTVLFNRETVFIDLAQKYNDIYSNYSRSARQNLKKAIANNLNVMISENEFPYKSEFIGMYNETMDRVNAEKYLYFNENYFQDTFCLPGLVQFTVFRNELPIASALCLMTGEFIHIHFLVFKSEFLSWKPSGFLIDAVIKYGNEKGFKELHIGGGRTSDPDDSLLRFKKNFARSTKPFLIGSRVFNSEVYKRIILQWEKKFPQCINKHNFRVLCYRYTS